MSVEGGPEPLAEVMTTARPRTNRLILLLALAATAGVACEPSAGDGGTTGTGGSAGGSSAQGGAGGRGGSGGGAGTGGTPAPATGGQAGSSQGGAGAGSGSGGGQASGGSGGGQASGGSEGGGGAPAPDGGGATDTGAPADGAPEGDGGGSSTPSAEAKPSPACAGGAMMPGPAGNQTIMANGKNRTFILRLPTGYDGKRPLPILFGFHGAGGGAASFESGVWSGLSRMAADKALRIFPQAFGGNTWARDEPDDVLFMDALMQWLSTRVCFDTARVFATGQSSGAYFSNRWACDRGTVVRAVATNSGGQRKERALDCKNPVSAWLSNGSGDDPGHVMGTQQARDVWLKLAGCTTMSMPTTPSPCVNYTGCRAGFVVNYCQHGGGHAFPGYGTGGIYNFLFGGKL
jgi:polyhydroxybutyrate depolymerase